MTTQNLKIEVIDGYRLIWVNSTNLSFALKCIKSGTADGVFLSRMNGFASRDLPLVCQADQLKALVVHLVDEMDLSIVRTISNLQMLKIGSHRVCRRNDVDLERVWEGLGVLFPEVGPA